MGRARGPRAGRGRSGARALGRPGADPRHPRRHELRRHPRPREHLPGALRAAADARLRGGRRGRARRRRLQRRPARRRARGRRRLRGVRRRAGRDHVRDPRRRVGRRGARARHPGPDRLAPVQDLGAAAPGRERRRPRRGRRRRLARRPARPPVRRGPRDRHRVERGQARARAQARRRRGRRRHARGPRRRAARGQRGRGPSTSSSRWRAGACSTRPTTRWRRSGASSPTGSPARQANQLDTGRAHAPQPRRDRVLADALPAAPAGDADRAPARPDGPRSATTSCASSRARSTGSPRCAARTRTSRRAGPAASCCSIPRAEAF